VEPTATETATIEPTSTETATPAPTETATAEPPTETPILESGLGTPTSAYI
jgi:hypothetical protein